MESARNLPRQSSHTSSQYSATPLTLPATVPPSHYSQQQHQYPQQQQQQQQPYQQHAPIASTPTQAAYPHTQPPPPVPSIELRAQQQQQHNPHQQHHQTHPSAYSAGTLHGQPYSSAGVQSGEPYHHQGSALPPIVTREGAGSHHNHHHQQQQQQHHHHQALPPQHRSGAHSQPSSEPPQFRPPSSPHHSSHDAVQEHADHTQGLSQPRAEHATTAQLAMQRPLDLMRQGTPLTPAHAGAYPGQLLPESRTPIQHMDHGHPHPYPPSTPMTNGVHGPPHQLHHDTAPPSYAATPTMDHQPAPYPMQGQYQPSQQPMYQPGFGPVAYGQTAATGANKRKPMRAQQACEQCRQRKQKCDEGQPCSFCREQGISCHYRDPGPAKTDKNTERLLTDINTLVEQFNSYRDELRMQSADTKKILAAHSILGDRLTALEKAHDIKPSLKRDYSEDKVETSPSVQSVVPTETEPVMESDDAAATTPETWSDHRTGAHNLILLWPSVRPFFKDMREYDRSYVTEAEERGIIRINGKGQGVEDQETAIPPGPASPARGPGGPGSPARSEDSHDSAPTPREGLWGRGYISSVSTTASRTYGMQGGLLADGTLDISTTTVNSLFDSFMKHMYIMHPFLDRKRTRRMVDTFIKYYSPSGISGPGFATSGRHQANGESGRGTKRARSDDGPIKTATPISENSTKTPLQIEHSPANAIVLMILALGKICQCTEPLPGVLGDKTSSVQSLPPVTNGNPTSSPLPMQFKPPPFSPRTTPNAQSTPSDGSRVESRSRRQSLDASVSGGNNAKNIEFVPGLAYYAKGAEIIGGHFDGSDLMHAQMFLLSALYKGQLARVKESAGSLFLAGKICQQLVIRHKLYRQRGAEKLELLEVQEILKDRRKRGILLAASTCLQLEADILAEMSYPPSPVQAIESYMMPLCPDTEDDEYWPADQAQAMGAEIQQDIDIFQYYISQLYLRRRLNNAHQVLYGHVLRNQSVENVRESLQAQQREIQHFRQCLTERLSWSDDDPPASNILAARLRAKWYGASYVIHRPFLDYALHIMPRVGTGECTVEEAARDAEGKPRDQADIMLFKSMQSMPDEEIWAATKQCIAAALQSTVALDGMSGRLIVTNIHGTAHAQFGNMLVLAAAYHAALPEGMVKREMFEPKLVRTIRFLRRLTPISPTAAFDCSILERIHQQLFSSSEEMQTYHNEREPVSATTSFSAQ